MIYGLLRFLLLLVAGWAIARAIRRFLPPPQPKLPQDSSSSAQEALVACSVCHDFRPTSAGPCAHNNCPRRVGKLVLVWLAGLLLAFAATPAWAQDGGRYMIELKGSRVKATLFVNDIPAEVWTLGETPDEAGASFNHWLQGGRNVVRLSVEKTGGPATLQARIYYMGLSGTDGAPMMVDLLRLDRVPDKSQPSEIGFTVAHSPDLTLWAQGEQASPENDFDTFSAAIAGLKDDVVKALQAGAEDVAYLPSLKGEQADLAAAYGALPDATKRTLGSGAASGTVEEKVAIAFSATQEELNISALPLRPDLFHVVRKDGKPLIYAEKGPLKIQIDGLMLAKRAGLWQILRRTH